MRPEIDCMTCLIMVMEFTADGTRIGLTAHVNGVRHYAAATQSGKRYTLCQFTLERWLAHRDATPLLPEEIVAIPGGAP